VNVNDAQRCVLRARRILLLEKLGCTEQSGRRPEKCCLQRLIAVLQDTQGIDYWRNMYIASMTAWKSNIILYYDETYDDQPSDSQVRKGVYDGVYGSYVLIRGERPHLREIKHRQGRASRGRLERLCGQVRFLETALRTATMRAMRRTVESG